jgi:hypothetical protein
MDDHPDSLLFEEEIDDPFKVGRGILLPEPPPSEGPFQGGEGGMIAEGGDSLFDLLHTQLDSDNRMSPSPHSRIECCADDGDARTDSPGPSTQLPTIVSPNETTKKRKRPRLSSWRRKLKKAASTPVPPIPVPTLTNTNPTHSLLKPTAKSSTNTKYTTNSTKPPASNSNIRTNVEINRSHMFYCATYIKHALPNNRILPKHMSG